MVRAAAARRRSRSGRGPIDRSETGIPFFGRLNGREDVVYGVGPCVLGGRILASLVLRCDDRYAHNGLTKGPKTLFPPEPIRFVGGLLVREAVRRKESLEDEGRQANPLVRAVASLAPAGLFKVSEPHAAQDPHPLA